MWFKVVGISLMIIGPLFYLITNAMGIHGWLITFTWIGLFALGASLVQAKRGNKKKTEKQHVISNENSVAQRTSHALGNDKVLAEKKNQEDYIQAGDNSSQEIERGVNSSSKSDGNLEKEVVLQDKNIILEEGKPYLKYRPHKCPYCDSINISESIVQVAKNEKESKLLGYSYLWEGKCADCTSSWYSIEGSKQVPEHIEPTGVEEKKVINMEAETNYCYKCGRSITPEMAFCPKCGHKIT